MKRSHNYHTTKEDRLYMLFLSSVFILLAIDGILRYFCGFGIFD